VPTTFADIYGSERMTNKTMSCTTLALTVVLAATVPAAAGSDVYRAMGLKTKDVLAGTIFESRVVPGKGEQVVCIATFMTGKSDKADAVNVRLGVFDRFGKGLVTVYTRDLGMERGGYVANGDLQLLDLDLDGINEMIVSFDSFEDPLIEQRLAEVILHDGSSFIAGWSGAVEYDATKAARNVPRERRDRFMREFDFGNTMRTRGVTLFVKKRMIAVAGQRLPEPRIIEETYPLRPPPDHW
jgi:hypothetical protein